MADVYRCPCDQVSELLSVFAAYLNIVRCAPLVKCLHLYFGKMVYFFKLYFKEDFEFIMF